MSLGLALSTAFVGAMTFLAIQLGNIPAATLGMGITIFSILAFIHFELKPKPTIEHKESKQE